MAIMAAAKTFHLATTDRRTWRGWMRHDSNLDADYVEQLFGDTDQWVARGRMLKDGDRCTVVAVDSLGDGPPMVLKRYNLKNHFHTATHAVMRSRAAWGWINATRLLEAGLPTPRPLAMLEERRGGVLRMRSYLLTTFVPGRSLLDVVQAGGLDGARLRDQAKQFTVIWQKLGQLRLGHGDMKASNFLVDPDHRLWLIDLDGMRRHRSLMWLRRERRNDMRSFMRNWRDRPDVAAIFRARIGNG